MSGHEGIVKLAALVMWWDVGGTEKGRSGLAFGQQRRVNLCEARHQQNSQRSQCRLRMQQLSPFCRFESKSVAQNRSKREFEIIYGGFFRMFISVQGMVRGTVKPQDVLRKTRRSGAINACCLPRKSIKVIQITYITLKLYRDSINRWLSACPTW